MAKRRNAKVIDPTRPVRGPTPDPASNLMMADIAIRAGSYLVRHFVERRFLRGRYGRETARDIVANRSLGQTVASVAASKIATRSVPGAVVVGAGLAVKLLFDRSRKRREAQRAGDRKLLDQAEGE